MPDRDEIRLFGLAIGCGLIAEGGLVLGIFGGLPSQLGILLFVEAAILGGVFGARAGMAAAVVPLAVLFGAELVRRATGADADQSAGYLGVAVLFVAIVMAFCAGMTGALRDRYFVR